MRKSIDLLSHSQPEPISATRSFLIQRGGVYTMRKEKLACQSRVEWMPMSVFDNPAA